MVINKNHGRFQFKMCGFHLCISSIFYFSEFSTYILDLIFRSFTQSCPLDLENINIWDK